MNRIRILLFLSIILIISSSIFTFVFLDNDFFLRKWNIPSEPRGFYDSRQFAWASESSSRGYDPLVQNPANPKGQPLNYPRIWHILFTLGINENHTDLMGTIVVIIFFIGIGLFWFSRNFDNLTYLALFIAFLSPALMLGVERSNIELTLFFVLSAALLINYYSSISALPVFIFASVLKVYPVFGFVYLMKENKRRFWILFLSASGIFILYALLSLHDFLQVYKTTPKLVGSSFGINVWWMGLRHSRFLNLSIPDSLALFLKVFSYVLALMIIATTLYWSMRKKEMWHYTQGQYLDAFRVGAGIYIGCFLIMNTHDYRLVFLIFTIPQLVEWLRDKEKGFAKGPLITLMAMMFSLWSFFVMRFLGRKLTFVMEEFCNWIVFAGLLYLFFSSLPRWLTDLLHKPQELQKAEHSHSPPS